MNSPANAGGAATPPKRTIDYVNASLPRRYAAERRFRYVGAGAVVLGLAFVVILFFDIVSKGYTAFQQTYIKLPVTFSAEEIDPEGTGDPAIIGRANFLKLVREGLRSQFPEVSGRSEKRALDSLLSPGAPQQVARMAMEDPSLIGTTQDVWVLANDDIDMFMKGRSTDVDTERGSGIASPTGTTGEIQVLSTVNDFAMILDDVKDFLESEARKAERDLRRLEGNLEEIDQELVRGREALAAVPAGDEAQRARIEGGIRQLEDRRSALAADVERKRVQAQKLRARADAPGAEERLTADMPSYLVRINGGLVKVTLASATGITGEIFKPLVSDADAAKGEWEILEFETPENARRLKDKQVAWAFTLKENRAIEKKFNTIFFTHGASREPELAGIAGALVGSLYTLLLTLLFSFPIGVGAAMYLEEFAPKNRITDLIEVNINNLAAVPSIVFGLLGLAVFINFFGVPRSTPLVGALVLTLMTLPTIIIASRAALKSVPPSIREGALGVGASPLQTQFHHVLPLAMPGMLTGTIIGMAQALGETAPLLMIGMIAFIVDIPGGFTDPSTVLPVQIFLWADSPEIGFVERTSAAIMVLLGFLIVMNLTAVLLRKKFERRW
jgi:phosphate transport system permease protein